MVDEVILPTPNAVLMAAELLSRGYGDELGLGDLMLADVGGATTDIYSMGSGLPTQMNAILSGLEEPYAKRTVEGDLGMRYSSLGILDTLVRQKKVILKQKVLISNLRQIKDMMILSLSHQLMMIISQMIYLLENV